jgi:hypothetical protein
MDAMYAFFHILYVGFERITQVCCSNAGLESRCVGQLAGLDVVAALADQGVGI